MIFVSAFIIGLLGSWHCVGMCGPILSLTPGGSLKHPSKFSGYHFGRILSYVIIGATVFTLGQSFNMIGVQKQISLVVGGLLLTACLISMFRGGARLNSIENRLGAPVFSLLKRYYDPKKRNSLVMGLINGFLPCGLVYVTALGTLILEDGFYMTLYMVAFGLGTVPMLLLFIAFKDRLKKNLKINISRTSALQLSFFIVGTFLILRGLELGIPFISPELDPDLLTSGKPSCH
ncbi:MAG: sulfite exporter TauE/SafE family protein [Flavobacteriales bacterium]|nr:sulfite exporter TauE/SafE family protein [Flavobacteriales bacterium]